MLEVLYRTNGSQVHCKQNLYVQKQVMKPYDVVMCPLIEKFAGLKFRKSANKIV